MNIFKLPPLEQRKRNRSPFHLLRFLPQDHLAIVSLKPKICLLILVVFLSACKDDSSNKEGFLDILRSSVREPGSEVLVSSIWGGSWEKVCFSRTGNSISYNVLDTIEESEGIPFESIIPINTKRSRMEPDLFSWGIFFYYPPNKVEYFEIDNYDMFPRRGKDDGVDKYRCAEREYAVIRSVETSDKKPMLIKLLGKDGK